MSERDSAAPVETVAMLGRGVVHHRRLRPVAHAFDYPSYFLMLPLRAIERGDATLAIPRGRWGLLSFHDADHGLTNPSAMLPDPHPHALRWCETFLRDQGVDDIDGEIWLMTYPRVLGYVFKPVSFWFCHRADGGLRAVVVEVNNTFGERHCYLLDSSAVAFGAELEADKCFHVSPFCRIEGGYRFRFHRSDTHVVARVDHHDDVGALLQTSLSGALVPLTRARARRVFFAMPLMTLGVVWRIHWQAFKLWAKRVPFHTKPKPPLQGFSR